MRRVLITGANGQLAEQIMQAAPPQIECVGLSRTQADIADAEQIASALKEARPDFVINGAAYNLVDNAETDGLEAAISINTLGAGVLSRACRDTGVPLMHFSTDFVFDGDKRTPYTETDAARPLSNYGASKLAGENMVLAASPRNFAVRVCRLFGPTSSNGPGSQAKPSGNFPLLMLRLAKERGHVRVVNDQIGSPSYTPDLARAVWQLTEYSDGGLYHLSNAGEVSFADYAQTIFELANVECEVEGISSEEYGAPARRPKYSTLSNAKAQAIGVEPLRDWREALEEFLGTVLLES